MRIFWILLTTLAACARPALKAENNADRLLGRDRDAIFDRYVAQVNDAQAFNPQGFKRMSTTWEKELRIPRESFRSAKTSDDVYYAAVQLNNSVRDGHAWVVFPKDLEPDKPSVSSPVGFYPWRDPASPDGEWQFVVFRSSIPEVSVGDRLISIDHIPAHDVVENFRPWYSGNSPEDLAWRAATWLGTRRSGISPAPAMGSALELRVRKFSGAEAVANTTWERLKKRDPDPCPDGEETLEGLDYAGLTLKFRGLNYCVYVTANKTAIVRYTFFLYTFDRPGELDGRSAKITYDKQDLVSSKNSQELFKVDLHHLIQFLTPFRRILFDLRENRGGNLDYDLIGAFTKKPFATTTSQLVFTPFVKAHPDLIPKSVDGAAAGIYLQELSENQNAERSSVRPFFCKTPVCDRDEEVIKPKGELSRAKVWIFTGPTCMSACDQVAVIFKENHIARIIGLAPHGSSSPYRVQPTFDFLNGKQFSMVLGTGINYDSSDRPIDGNPVHPDIELPPPNEPGTYLRAALQRVGF